MATSEIKSLHRRLNHCHVKVLPPPKTWNFQILKFSRSARPCTAECVYGPDYSCRTCELRRHKYRGGQRDIGEAEKEKEGEGE